MSAARLPPGQKEMDHFPRFGVPLFARRMPALPDAPRLEVRGEVAHEASFALGDLGVVPRVEIVADFHCVATWSCRGVRWSGYRFRDVWDTVVAPVVRPSSAARYVQLVCFDGYETCIGIEDLRSEDVLLADRLDDEPLTVDHGAPLRLVAPSLYGFKNAKHLCGLVPCTAYRRGLAERKTFAHPRARVAHEERGRFGPQWFFRHFYRALIRRTLAQYSRAVKENVRRRS